MTHRQWAALVVAAVGLWSLLAAASLWQGARDLQAARVSLTSAVQELQGADLSIARDDLAQGRDAAARAATALGRPWVAPLRLLPVVGDNLDAAAVLAAGARDLSTAGGAVLDVASDIVHEDVAGADRGQVPLPYLERLQPGLDDFHVALRDTVARVDGLACEHLLRPVGRACQRFMEVAEPALAPVHAGAEMARVAPALLGGDEERTYLVFAASYSELRGSMGLLGSWALMTADAGRLDVGPFRETADLPVPDGDVRGPSVDFTQRYGRYGVLRDWRNANMSPSFPDTAEVVLDLWDAGGGVPVDGVLVTSPLVVEGMIEALGPMEVPGVTTLTRQNARRFVGLDAYAAFDSQGERKRVLGTVATAGFERMLDVMESSDVMTSAAMLQELVVGGDVRMYVREPEVQDSLSRVGLAGDLPTGDGEFASVVVNNVAGNKVDYFTTRQLRHDVRLLPGGVTAAEVEITLRNDAPVAGYPRYVLGPATALAEAGDNLSLVSLYCGQDCTLTGRPNGVQDGGRERGLPVWDLTLRLSPGAEHRVAYRTETKDGWYRDGQDIVVPVRHVVQPTLHEAPLHLRVEVPDGWAPVALPVGAELVDGGVALHVAGGHDVDVEVRLRPTPQEGTFAGTETARR